MWLSGREAERVRDWKECDEGELPTNDSKDCMNLTLQLEMAAEQTRKSITWENTWCLFMFMGQRLWSQSLSPKDFQTIWNMCIFSLSYLSSNSLSPNIWRLCIRGLQLLNCWCKLKLKVGILSLWLWIVCIFWENIFSFSFLHLQHVVLQKMLLYLFGWKKKNINGLWADHQARRIQTILRRFSTQINFSLSLLHV